MRTLMLFIFVLTIGGAMAPRESRGETPGEAGAAVAVSPTDKARLRFNDAVAKADKVCNEALATASATYLEGLQQAMDAAMKAANIEEAKFVRDETERVKAGKAPSLKRSDASMTASAQSRYSRASEKALDDRRRALELARRQFVTELESSKRAALTESKNLDEATRIAAELERVKVMEFPPTPTAVPSAPNTKPEGSAEPHDARDGAAVAGSIAARGSKINLLKLVDLQRDPVLYGEFSFDRGNLVVGGNRFKSIQFPYQPPLEYDFSVDVTIDALNDGGDLVLNGCYREQGFFFNSGQWHNKRYVFWDIDGKPAGMVEKERIFSVGQRVVVQLQVRMGEVSGWIDGKKVTSIESGLGQLRASGHTPWGTGLRALGFGTFNRVTIHSAEVAEVSGPGKVIRRIDAQQARKPEADYKTLKFSRSISLTDLAPREVQTLQKLLVNETVEQRPVIVDGKDCRKFLATLAPSSLLYEIPEGATAFRTTATRPGGTFRADIGQWRVSVLADDCEIYVSPTGIQQSGGRFQIKVALPRGAKMLELRAHPMGDPDWDHCVWANPEFAFP